jgi:hypothetical protein
VGRLQRFRILKQVVQIVTVGLIRQNRSALRIGILLPRPFLTKFCAYDGRKRTQQHHIDVLSHIKKKPKFIDVLPVIFLFIRGVIFGHLLSLSPKMRQVSSFERTLGK